MKANIENIKQALKLCAEAHGVEYFDWVEDEQFAIKSESIPVITDVKAICRAFYGKSFMTEVDWGYTTVYLADAEFKDKVDEMTLSFALPFGWINKIKEN